MLDKLAMHDPIIQQARMPKLILQSLELGISEIESKKREWSKVEPDEFFFAYRQAEDDLAELEYLDSSAGLKDLVIQEKKALRKLLPVLHAIDEMFSLYDTTDVDGGDPIKFETTKLLAAPILYSAKKSHERIIGLLKKHKRN